MNHAFAFKLITIKFGEFTNFWMLFQMTVSIFKVSIQSILKIRSHSPARLEHG